MVSLCCQLVVEFSVCIGAFVGTLGIKKRIGSPYPHARR